MGLAVLAALGAGPAIAMTVPASVPLVEGIASDGRRLWVSSVADGAIWTLTPAPRRAFRVPARFGAPLGIAFDARRRWLWVAASCVPELHTAGCAGGHLLAFNSRGTLRARLRPAGDSPFAPGDVTVSGNRLLVSDSRSGAVHGCALPCRRLEPLVAAHERGSAQGAAWLAPGRTIVFADYGLGVSAVDVATGRRTVLRGPDDRPLRGVDGLVALGGRLVAVQNGAPPSRVLSFRVAGDRLVDVELLAEGAPLGEATQVTVHRGRLMAVGDAQWESYLGQARKPQRITPIVALPLPR